MMTSIPNLLTFMRILLIPVFAVAYYLPYSWSNVLVASLFAIAGLTDWFDGYLARKLKQESRFGEFLDPVADKLIVVVALVLLVESFGSVYLSIPALVIIGREIVVSALREFMAEYGARRTVAVVFIGKLKTSLQILAIFLLLWQPHSLDFSNPIIILAFAILYLAVLLTLWSMFVYLYAARGLLTHD